LDIKSISASRIKTFEHCNFKYILNYMLKECNDCEETFYTVEQTEPKQCPHCGGEDYSRVTLRSNWGANHGTALHQIMENYALAIRGTTEDGKKVSATNTKKWLNWQNELKRIYKRGTDNGQTDPDFAIFDIAKPKDVTDPEKWCISCQSGKEDALCKRTGETLAYMNTRGCQGCPEGLYHESIKIMTKYVARHDAILRNKKILGIEAAFNIDFGMKDIHGNDMRSTGFIDLVVEEDPDTCHIIDHKFGMWKPSFDEFSEDIQVKLYSYAARKLFPGYKEYLVTFDYARTSPLSYSFTEEEDELTRQQVVKYWESIAGPQMVRRTMVQGDGKDPESSWKCKVMCDAQVCKKQWPIFKEKFGG